MRSSLLLMVLAGACSPPKPSLGTSELPVFDVTLQVIDEGSSPIAGAEVEVMASVEAMPSDASGHVRLSGLHDVTQLIVRSPGRIAEPVVVGRTDADQTVTVRLLDAEGRRVIHFGGDMMFGRRYEGQGLIRQGSRRVDAAEVVARIAPAFSSADLSIANLECVLSERDLGQAYPRKRFLLRSHPDTVEALHALGIDLVIASNNHTRDWLDVGIEDTLAVLQREGLPSVGAGLTAAQASEPALLNAEGFAVGVVAYTTVDGDFVNDSYPTADDPSPPDLLPTEAWQYERRAWGIGLPEFVMPTDNRRVGEVWQRYAEVERHLPDDVRATVWQSMAEVYPELQDWTARRGHGGAAPWDGAASRADIEQLADRVELVVVQLHAGFQFQEAPSENVRRIAHDAIDSGADIVIAHHPHVLQGVEWYRGKLVVYSLGNFVFDQDFLVTFPSAFLRTIWEGRDLVEARLVPVELDGYRPSPVADDPARRTLTTVWERSVNPVSSRRLEQFKVGLVGTELDPDTSPPVFVMERHTARIEPGESGQPVSVEVSEEGTTLEPGLYSFAQSSSAGLQLGKELFGWGSFEDAIADQSNERATHFDIEIVDRGDKALVSGEQAAEGDRFVRMRRWVYSNDDLLVRPVARVPLLRHRRYDDAGNATDGEPTWEVTVQARRSGRGEAGAYVRVDYYIFDDTNPTEDPSSVLVGEQRSPIEIPKDEAWHAHQLQLDVPPEANAALMYIVLEPADGWEAILDVDDLQVLEWRDLASTAEGFGFYTHVRGGGGNIDGMRL